jgi:hypothetical protein
MAKAKFGKILPPSTWLRPGKFTLHQLSEFRVEGLHCSSTEFGMVILGGILLLLVSRTARRSYSVVHLPSISMTRTASTTPQWVVLYMWQNVADWVTSSQIEFFPPKGNGHPKPSQFLQDAMPSNLFPHVRRTCLRISHTSNWYMGR